MNNSCVVVRVYVLLNAAKIIEEYFLQKQIIKLMHTINMKYVCINSIHLKSLNQHLTALYSKPNKALSSSRALHHK